MDGHNLEDYEAARESFEWDDVYREADWDAPDRLNIAHETCDRHADDRGKVALYHVGTDGEATTTTFWELARESNRVANLLTDLVDRGSRVFSYMPRVPEHYAAMLGTFKAGRSGGASTSASARTASPTGSTTATPRWCSRPPGTARRWGRRSRTPPRSSTSSSSCRGTAPASGGAT